MRSIYNVVGEAKARQLQDIERANIKGRKEVKTILGSETVIMKRSDPQHRMIWEKEFRDKYPWNERAEAEVPLIELNDSSLTKSMPMADLEPKIQIIDSEPEDKLIIVSDGMSNYSLTPEIGQIVRDPANKDAGMAADGLVKFAKKDEAVPGGKSGMPQDDTTAVVVDIK